MWEGLHDRVTDTVFRMEDAPEEAMQEALWAGAGRRRPRRRRTPSRRGRRPRTTRWPTHDERGEREEGRADPQLRREGRPQRPVPVRQRQEVQELPHEDGPAALTVSTRPGMRDITSPRWLYVKGVLFLVCGLFASALLLVESPTFQTRVPARDRGLELLPAVLLRLLRH